MAMISAWWSGSWRASGLGMSDPIALNGAAAREAAAEPFAVGAGGVGGDVALTVAVHGEVVVCVGQGRHGDGPGVLNPGDRGLVRPDQLEGDHRVGHERTVAHVYGLRNLHAGLCMRSTA